MNKTCLSNQQDDRMMITKYRPQHLFNSPFNGLVNEFFSRDIGHLIGRDDFHRTVPSVNIVERECEFELRLLAPGFSKDDLKLSVEYNTLTILAEHKTIDLKEGERITRREFSQSGFSRSFRLPEGLAAENIKAEHNNGVLTVTFPKTESTTPKARQISIS